MTFLNALYLFGIISFGVFDLFLFYHAYTALRFKMWKPGFILLGLFVIFYIIALFIATLAGAK